MFYLDQQTRKRYRIGTPFTYGGIQYTSAGATHDTFIKLGFKQVIPAPRPDDNFYIVNSPCNDDGSWTATPRDLQQLKDRYVAEQVTTGQKMLCDTDWAFTRDYETTTTGHENLFTVNNVPSDIQVYRQQVRDVGLSRITAIENCATVDELIALLSAPAEVPVVVPGQDPNADAMATMENPAPHLKPWPTLEAKALETDVVQSFLQPSKQRALTPEDKLNLIGLTVDELKVLLDLKVKS